MSMEHKKILGYHEKTKSLNCGHRRRSKREESQTNGSDNVFNKIIKEEFANVGKEMIIQE